MVTEIASSACTACTSIVSAEEIALKTLLCHRARSESPQICEASKFETPATLSAVDAPDGRHRKASDAQRSHDEAAHQGDALPSRRPRHVPGERARRSEAPRAPAGVPPDDIVLRGLGETMQQMVHIAIPCDASTLFHSAWPPATPIADYVAHKSCCSSECFMLALIYIDRIIKRGAQVEVAPLTCHRIIATALVLAMKFQDDDLQSDAAYSRACGIPLRELSCLERAMLQLLSYKLCLHPAEYDLYRCILFRAGGGCNV